MNERDRDRNRRWMWLAAERGFGLEAVLKETANKVAVNIPSNATSTTSTTVLPAPTIPPSAANLATPQDSPTIFSSIAPAPLTLPILSRDEKIAALSVMDTTEVQPCTKCRLSQTRANTVFGEGDPAADIFFIGEGPGENEDLKGRPFVGRAGELLNKMIKGMGLERHQVFIANIVKCRPPNNRVPAPDEVETCTPYLVRQLEIIRPKVIVTLGLPSAKYMLGSKLSMGKLRGQWHDWHGIKLMPTFHPAYLLRAYTDENRALVWSDLKKVMAEVGLPEPAKPARQ
jgi:uracil-DNA glycosylase